MPFTATVRDIANRDPARLALVGADEHLTYGDLASELGTATDPVICETSAFAAARKFVRAASTPGLVTTVLDPHWPAAHRERAIAASARVNATPGDDDFLLLFSSGTTSAPKGFLKTRAQYRANIAHSRRALRTGEGVRTLAPGFLAYSLTLYTVVEVLATGGTVYLTEDASGCRALIDQHQIQRLVTVPALLPALCRGPLPSLETIIVGGAHLAPGIRDAVAAGLPDATLISYYGTAEIGFIGESLPDGSITPYPGVEVDVRGSTLWVRTASASDRYVTTNTPLSGADGWVSVGDQARWDDGRLILLGRNSDVITTGGHTVSLTEVDAAFATMPQLTGCCAIAEDDPVRGLRIGLVVEGRVTRDDLTAWARAHLAPQYRPRRWYQLASLPRTSGGKIQRGTVHAAVTRGEADPL